jgi:pimeloyl-ACP methyl ester carboxylesterase
VGLVLEAVEASDDSAVLVGHSFGGFVISHVAERTPNRIELLVYLAAFLLRRGETVLGVAGSASPTVSHLEVREASGLIVVRPDRAREVFYDDCSVEDADRAAALLVPEALSPRRTPAEVTEERFGTVRNGSERFPEPTSRPSTIERFRSRSSDACMLLSRAAKSSRSSLGTRPSSRSLQRWPNDSWMWGDDAIETARRE